MTVSTASGPALEPRADDMQPSLPPVIIYRDLLGMYSETFITAQAGSMHMFRPIFVGSRVVSDRDGRLAGAVVASRGGPLGRFREYLFVRWGWLPARMQALADVNPLLLHAHFGPDGANALPLARKLGTPLVVTFHGYDVTMNDAFVRKSYLAHRLFLARREALKREAHAFIAVSQFIAQQMVKQGYAAERVRVHYIGIDTDVFCPDPAVTREPIVLFVGRLTAKKGCEHLIRALAPIQQADEAVELVVIGDGPLRAQVERLAADTLPRYRFLGPQSPAQVRAWMNRARVFCVPSHTASSGDAEAFGMVFAEAQAMGLPVASYAHGGIPEAVSDGETGLLAPEGDTQALSANIDRLLHDESLWLPMSAAGRPRVIRHFNLASQTRALEHIYSELL